MRDDEVETMHDFRANPRVRGIVAARANLRGHPGGDPDDPNQIIRALDHGFREFKASHSRELEAIQASLDQQAKDIAGLKLGGGGGGDRADDPRQRREVNAALRDFIGAGSETKLQGVMQPLAAAGGATESGPHGGYSVIPTFSDQITRRARERNPIRRLARNVVIGSGVFQELVDVDDAQSAWVSEHAPRPETNIPQLRLLTIPVREMYACPAVTQTLLDDSQVDIGGWLVERIGDSFADREGEAFVNGDGIAKPRGLLSYDTTDEDDDAREWGVIQHVLTGSNSGFDTSETPSTPADALIELMYALKSGYREGAVWLMNRKTAATVRKFTDENGQYIWRQGLIQGEPDTLMGFPVEIAEDMPDVAQDQYPIAFGNFERAYTVVDRLGVRLLRDPYTAKPNVLFYTYMRVGGAVNNTEAVKLLKVSA